MNFLEIAKKANTLSGLQGDVDSIVSPTGIQKTLIEYVQSAYSDIQLLRDSWSWMRVLSYFTWNSNSTSYTNATINKYLRIFYNKKDLRYIPYDTWYMTDHIVESLPTNFTIVPETGAIIVNPVDASFQIDYRAHLKPEELVSNTQTPLLPEEYHLAIAYKAAYKMGLSLGNSEVQNLNAADYDMIMSSLLRSKNLASTIRQRPLA